MRRKSHGGRFAAAGAGKHPTTRLAQAKLTGGSALGGVYGRSDGCREKSHHGVAPRGERLRSLVLLGSPSHRREPSFPSPLPPCSSTACFRSIRLS